MTETVKHTPGPWEVIEDTCGQCELEGAREFVIVGPPDGHHGQFSNEADAHLIAAAPDMLNALIMVRDADDDCKKDGLPSMPPFARAKLDAAIAKAEGRS